jgi:hypothetical protein
MSCKNHPDVSVGLVACSRCGASFCRDCVIELKGTAYCAACKEEQVKDVQSGAGAPLDADRLQQLLRIAKSQRGVLLCILGSIIMFFLPLAVVQGIAFLVILPFQLVFVYKLASSLKAAVPLVWTLCMFIPLLSLVLLLILSQRATRALQGAGFKVGLLGAKVSDIEARLASPART